MLTRAGCGSNVRCAAITVIASRRNQYMKKLLRSLLVLTLVVGAGACTSVLGPEHSPDAGNHSPDAGNHSPDAGNHSPDAGN